jgi:hypothetical protein
METKMKEIEKLQGIFQNVSEECNTIGGIVSSPDAGSGIGTANTGGKLMGKMELLQDRWDALSQILEAQSQRVSFLIIFSWNVLCVPACS